MPQRFRTNEYIADRMREVADLLAQQGANPFRVTAYRRAADTVVDLDRDVADIVAEEGRAGLIALPNIGSSLAAAIDEMAVTGRWAQLERLRGTLAPEKLFQTVPGIGPNLARDIHDHLHIETLEGLEQAAHDGRLETVPGVGVRRAATVRATLAQMLQRVRPRPPQPGEEPAIDTILDVDLEYRTKSNREALPKIAPHRFNPSGEAWLPILHTDRGDWHFTAMFSNTARAHEFGHTRDWVVIYYHKDDRPEGQSTVVTETRGELVGRRVVRGRESDCRAYYARQDSDEAASA
ncbi:MAG: DNA-binding protein [Alphaproteobacteria bacterium]|nr:DNA-binding protein [Alphaproteobacteria bacterium]